MSTDPTADPEEPRRPARRVLVDVLQALVDFLPEPAQPPAGESADAVRREDADLRPHRTVKDALEPLTQEGFQINDTVLDHAPDRSQRQVTLLDRGDDQYFLVGLRGGVIRSSAESSRLLIASFDLLFPRGCTVYFVSPDSDAMGLPLQRTIEAYRNITAVFVPWLWIQPDRDGTPQPARQLMNAFNLQPTQKDGLAMMGLSANGSAPNPRRELKPDEVDAIARNLTAHMEANGGRDFFDDFIDNLALEERAVTRARAKWGSDGAFAAKKLVVWVRSQGPPMITRVLLRLIDEGIGRPDVPHLVAILQDCGDADDQTLESVRARVREVQG